MQSKDNTIRKDTENGDRSLTIASARKILGEKSDLYTDKQLQIIIESIYGLASVTYALHQRKQK